MEVPLSNDIEKDPGDFTNVFCLVSVIGRSTHLLRIIFTRVQLLEADHSIFKYDLISLCETSLNDSVKLPDSLLDNYTFVSRNSSNNTRHGGVGLFYKNSLPLVVRDDLGFDETIVVELKFGRIFLFFTLLYRSPSQTNNSPKFENFLQNIDAKIKSENPYSIFLTGDLYGHSQLW